MIAVINLRLIDLFLKFSYIIIYIRCVCCFGFFLLNFSLLSLNIHVNNKYLNKRSLFFFFGSRGFVLKLVLYFIHIFMHKVCKLLLTYIFLALWESKQVTEQYFSQRTRHTVAHRIQYNNVWSGNNGIHYQ